LGREPLSRFFRALGDTTRLRIVALLCHGELCVCHLVSALGRPRSNIPRQLGILRSAGLVEGRRSKPWMRYRLTDRKDDHLKRVLRETVRAFANQEMLHEDLQRLRASIGGQPVERVREIRDEIRARVGRLVRDNSWARRQHPTTDGDLARSPLPPACIFCRHAEVIWLSCGAQRP
jgi:ArsR family transcriptional regulator